MYIHYWVLVVYESHNEFRNVISTKITAFNSISKINIIQQQINTNIEMQVLIVRYTCGKSEI